MKGTGACGDEQAAPAASHPPAGGRRAGPRLAGGRPGSSCDRGTMQVSAEKTRGCPEQMRVPRWRCPVRRGQPGEGREDTGRLRRRGAGGGTP